VEDGEMDLMKGQVYSAMLNMDGSGGKSEEAAEAICRVESISGAMVRKQVKLFFRAIVPTYKTHLGNGLTKARL
jgi:hypothetical protein